MKRAKDRSWSRGSLVAVRVLDVFADTRELTTLYQNHGARVRVFEREVRAGGLRATVKVLIARKPVPADNPPVSGQFPPS